MYVEAESVKTIHATVRGEIPGGGGSIAVDDTLTIPGAAADAAVVGEKVNALTEDIKEQWEKIPVVFPWAVAELPFTEAQISGTAEGAGFVNNPTNFADGKTYFRYHAGPNNFTWTNPNPQQGALTITVCGYSQYSDTLNTSLVVEYTDGTYMGIRLTHGVTVTATTDITKTVATIRGNYDFENWVLLDMDVLSIVADYPAQDKYIASYRIISDLDTNTHTLELKYNDGDVLSVKLPKMGIDIDRVVKFGTEDPTGETLGETKQLYVNTATGRMWVCENGNMMPMHWIGLSGAGSTDSEIEVPSLGSGGVSLGMTGAVVGQIAKITEVNESGVPTGWEPVDLPNGGGALEHIADINVTEWVNAITISKDSDGNPLSLSDMFVVMTLPKATNQAGEEVGTGYALYRVNGAGPAYQNPSSAWEDATFVWRITPYKDYCMVQCWKDGEFSMTGFHSDLIGWGAKFDTITSFTFAVFGADRGFASCTGKVYGVRA